MSLDRTLQKLILAPLEEDLRSAFADNLTDQRYVFEDIVSAYPDVIEGKPTGNLANILTERDMRAIRKLLEALKRDGRLYKAILDCMAIGSSIQPDEMPESHRKSAVMLALSKAGLLPAIQYVLCDSLLTGGIGCSEVRTADQAETNSFALSPQTPNTPKEHEKKLILKNPARLAQELAPLIAATGFSWEEFFTLGTPVVLHKSTTQMAMELDNPKILLAVLGKEHFTREDINQPRKDLYDQTILSYVLSNNKLSIEKQIRQDLYKQQNQQNSQPSAPTQEQSMSVPTFLSANPSRQGLQRYNLHAQNHPKNAEEKNEILASLATVATYVIFAAQNYKYAYPKAGRYKISKHTHQPDANLLIKISGNFLTTINSTPAVRGNQPALIFIKELSQVCSVLSSGKLLNGLLTKNMLSSLNEALDNLNDQRLTITNFSSYEHDIRYLKGLVNTFADLNSQPKKLMRTI